MKTVKISFAVAAVMTAVIIAAAIFGGCSKNTQNSVESSNQNNAVSTIDAKKAKQIMDSEKDYIILDVRTQEEYDDGHIKNAVLIPDYEIEGTAESKLADKNQKILVYCRSGRRSKNAAQTLANMGYTNVYDFGGIIDWPYETVK